MSITLICWIIVLICGLGTCAIQLWFIWEGRDRPKSDAKSRKDDAK